MHRIDALGWFGVGSHGDVAADAFIFDCILPYIAVLNSAITVAVYNHGITPHQ